MANFSITYKNTEAAEKGYTFDNGGHTYKGISAKGWGTNPLAKKILAIVLSYKPKKGQIIKDAALDELVIKFYKSIYWDKLNGDRINNQTLANSIYDFCVNSGAGVAICTEAVLGTKYNKIDDAFINKVNSNPAYYYSILLAARLSYIKKLSFDKKGKLTKLGKENYKGWMNRFNTFPKSI